MVYRCADRTDRILCSPSSAERAPLKSSRAHRGHPTDDYQVRTTTTAVMSQYYHHHDLIRPSVPHGSSVCVMCVSVPSPLTLCAAAQDPGARTRRGRTPGQHGARRAEVSPKLNGSSIGNERLLALATSASPRARLPPPQSRLRLTIRGR